MKKTSKRGHSTLSELNITPLLDLVFVLLVIFIITTPQMVNSVDINLPPGGPIPQQPDVPPKINRIEVKENGQVLLNDDPVPDEMIYARMKALKASDSDLKVVVKGADAVEYQNMIKVLDVLEQLDIKKVGLATQ